MQRVMSRVLVVFVAIALLTVVVTGGTLFYFVRESFPQTDGALKVAGLDGKVTIIRDSFGVPHIYADTPLDLFRAEGFVHAQDRFFQMEFWRRVGQGRLAELFGKSALGQDKYIRTLGWQRVAALEASSLQGETKSILNAYAAGVNAYALANPDKLSLEFRVLGSIGRKWQPEPWTPVNSLTWAKVMGWQLGGNISNQLLRAALSAKGGTDLMTTLMPPYPADAPVTVPTKRSGAGDNRDSRFEIVDATQEYSPVQSLTSNPQSPDSRLQSLISLLQATHDFESVTGLINNSEIGSNDWVIGGARTTTGKPIVANDPHLGVQMPSIWYQVGLHCRVVSTDCPYDVVGVSFAGAPGVIIGHNARIAWGVTNVKPAVQDLFIEHANPDNPDQFDYKGRWENARIIEEKINVAGEDTPVSLRVRITRHGPILSDVSSDMAGSDPIAVQWTGLQPGTLLQSVFKIDRAENWDDFRDALRDWSAPSQNFVYGDVDGNIGYQMPGKIPIRARGAGNMPMPGWSGEFEWTGYIPFDELPKLYNPSEGYIATANNAVVDSGYRYYLGEDWDQGYRIRRIRELIEAKNQLSVDDIKTIQGDNASGFAAEVLPYLAALNIPDDLTTHDALAELKNWDMHTTRNSIGAAIFEVYWRKLAHNLFDNVLGPDLAEQTLDVNDNTSTRTAMRILLADAGSHWWSDAAKDATSPRDHILIQTLRDTAATLKVKLGPDVKSWQYGRLHTITFKNQTLGKSGIAPIEYLFNRGPYPDDGAGASVNAQAGDHDMSVASAPSWRMIVDLGDFSRSQAIHTTGQSGHAFHPHYDDMIRPWIDIQYNPLLYGRGDVEKNAEATLTLTP